MTQSTPVRPTMFIGCAKEDLIVAETLQYALDRFFDCSIWTQNVFRPSSYTLTDLLTRAHQTQFAVMIMTSVDQGTSRGATFGMARDNIVLELGIFMGALGTDNVFILKSRADDIRMPSDLLGLNILDYRPRDNGDLESALGPPVFELKRRTLGLQAARDIHTVLNEAIATWRSSPRAGGGSNYFASDAFKEARRLSIGQLSDLTKEERLFLLRGCAFEGNGLLELLPDRHDAEAAAALSTWLGPRYRKPRYRSALILQHFSADVLTDALQVAEAAASPENVPNRTALFEAIRSGTVRNFIADRELASDFSDADPGDRQDVRWLLDVGQNIQDVYESE